MRTFRVTQGKGGRQKCAVHANHVSAVIQLDVSDHYFNTCEARCLIVLDGNTHGFGAIYANQLWEEVMELWLAALGDSR